MTCRARSRPGRDGKLSVRACECWSPAVPGSSGPMSSRRCGSAGTTRRVRRPLRPGGGRARTGRGAGGPRRRGRGLPPGGDGRPRHRLRRRARVRLPQRPRHGRPADRHGGRGRTAAGAGLLDGGVRRGPLRLRRARGRTAGPARREGPGGRAVRTAVPGVRGRPRAGSGRRGRARRPAQRVRHDQAGAGTPGRRVGAGDGRLGGVAALPQRVRPGDAQDTPYAGVASFFRSALARGEAPRVFEDGDQRRDFVHVRDVASANVAALQADPRAGVLTAYNTGSGTPHTVGDLAHALAEAHGGRPRSSRASSAWATSATSRRTPPA